eukprot:12312549-Alexandrium_andersonii.AAC.1
MCIRDRSKPPPCRRAARICASRRRRAATAASRARPATSSRRARCKGVRERRGDVERALRVDEPP